MAKLEKYLRFLSLISVCVIAFDVLANEQVIVRYAPQQGNESSSDCSLSQKIYCSLMTPTNCEECLECSMTAKPEDYCDCVAAQEFRYGLDTIITGPLWLRAKVQDILDNGLAAYWFADDSLDMTLFLRCDVSEGYQTLSVGANSFNIKSPERLKELLQQYGDIVELAGSMSVYLHVVPRSAGAGRAILNKYGEGFHSTCEDLFGVYFWMNYTYSHADNVYALPPSKAASLKFVQWFPLRVYATDRVGAVNLTVKSKSCTDGDTLASYILEDSIRVYFPDKQMLQDAKDAGDTLYFHFDGNHRGMIRFINTAKYLEDIADTVLCDGAILKLGQVNITADTVIADTTYVIKDTLMITAIKAKFTDVDTVYDVLKTEAKFPFYYRGQVVRQYGQMEFLEKESGKCSKYVYLTVEPEWKTTYESADTTICEGKTIKFGGKIISSNKTANDTVIVGVKDKSDTRIITTWKVNFEAPELEYDTITINKKMLPYQYETATVTHFGDTTLTIKVENECTRKVQLYVEKSELPLQYINQTIDTTVCRGKVFEVSGKTLSIAGSLTDSVAVAEDTIVITLWKVKFSQPELEYDTIYVTKSNVPTYYEGVAIGNFGTRTIMINKEDECTRRVQLTVERATEYKYQSVVDNICHGKYYELNGIKHTESFLYSDTVAVAEYESVVTTHEIIFAYPELEVLEEEVLLQDMPYQVADTAIADYGEHILYISQAGECDRYIQLTLKRAVEYVNVGRRDSAVCHGMSIALSGIRYWNNTVVADTLQIDEYSFEITEWHLSFVQPQAEYDTLYISVDDLPYQFGDTVFEDYGLYEILTLKNEECDELLYLSILPSATAVKELYYNKISIMPTKVKTGEHISIISPRGAEMQLIDILGRVLDSRVLDGGENMLLVDVPAGHYVIRIKTDRYTDTKKIIVENQ